MEIDGRLVECKCKRQTSKLKGGEKKSRVDKGKLRK